jgi:broad-specificity NMP kinase
VYENKKDELEKKLKIKISSRGYSENKVHYAVVDEILDFIISKVQGYGLIRHCMLELKD